MRKATGDEFDRLPRFDDAPFDDGSPPTSDEVTVLLDGTRLDTPEKVRQFAHDWAARAHNGALDDR